jgi:hypothetical protein
VHSQLRVAQEAAEKKGQEIRELNHMLKAWEAMRLGKDAQIAALMERSKRHEEDAAEKARTVEALRRKLAMAGRPASSGASYGAGGLGGSIGAGLYGSNGGGNGLGASMGALMAANSGVRHSWGNTSPNSPSSNGY